MGAFRLSFKLMAALLSAGAIPPDQKGTDPPLREFAGMPTACVNKNTVLAIFDAIRTGKDGKAIFEADDGCDSVCVEATLLRRIENHTGSDKVHYEGFKAMTKDGTLLYMVLSDLQPVSDEGFDTMKHVACLSQ